MAPELLRQWRGQKGLTQFAAANLVKVSAATWCDWEGGKKLPRVDKTEDIQTITEGAVKVGHWAEWARSKRVTAHG